ncbi:DUF1799 domain-containing protein [Chromobacterium vaccinii]|uniref:DUF1799 domain-containing protein n=1 Tax=Chromobacterium vaccinii TaxID=1108595 RepID=UPI000698C88F|nr:DUF1799 domain-containing protein [Chromobacterium vaccinii]
MRYQFGERAASRDENRRALLDAGVPVDQVDALLPGGGDESFSLLEDAVPAWRVWQGMQTQWRVGPAGPFGLDYAALPVVEQRLGIEETQRAAIFGHLQEMEREALRLTARKGK